jgi:hypothetical protein
MSDRASLGSVYGEGSWQWSAKRAALLAQQAISCLQELRGLVRAAPQEDDALLPAALRAELRLASSGLAAAVDAGAGSANGDLGDSAIAAGPAPKRAAAAAAAAPAAAIALEQLPEPLLSECLLRCGARELGCLEGSSTVLRAAVELHVRDRLQRELGVGTQHPPRRTVSIVLEKCWSGAARFLEARRRTERTGAHRLALGAGGFARNGPGFAAAAFAGAHTQNGRLGHELLLVASGAGVADLTPQTLGPTPPRAVDVVDHSQLGMGADGATYAAVRSLCTLVSVTAVAVAAHHAAFLADGSLLTVGRGECGRLGHGDTRDRLMPQIVAGFEDDGVRAVALTEKNTAFVTASGKCFCCGAARAWVPWVYPPTDAWLDVPTQVPGTEHVNSVALAATNWEALGLYDEPCWLLCLLTAEGVLSAHGSSADGVRMVEHCIAQLDGQRVASVAVGAKIVLAVTTLGHLFEVKMEKERDGMDGMGYHPGYGNHFDNPKAQRLLVGERVVMAAVQNDRIMYAGEPPSHNRLAQHAMALADTGRVFTWGTSTCGQLGHGSCNGTDIVVPRQVRALVGTEIVAIAAGASSSAALGADGQVFSWGALGSDGIKYDIPRLANGPAEAAPGAAFRFNF